MKAATSKPHPQFVFVRKSQHIDTAHSTDLSHPSHAIMEYTRLLLLMLALPSWPFAILTGLLTIPLIIYLYADYSAYVDLGQGGTPQTLAGYLRVKTLSLAAIHDPFDASLLPSTTRGHLTSLPDRGPRPNIRGIAPHRQITQRASPQLYEKLHEELIKLCSAGGDLKMDVSWFEKHNPALFTTKPTRLSPHGEICHAHPSDGSMHMTLHPADIQIVLDARWGERHPLARGGRFEMFVPEKFVMIYAPRTERDIDLVLQIVRAAACYVSGDESSTSSTSDQITRQ